MDIKILSELKTVMEAPRSLHSYFAWPTVTRLKNGDIAVGASGFRFEHICPFGKAVISESHDECESFSAPAPVIDTPLDDRDCGLCAFGESGLIVTSFNNEVSFQRQYNKDNAYVQAYLDTVTEEDEEKYLGSTFRISYDNGVTFSDIIKSPVTSPHGPVQLSDGRILWVGRQFRDYSAHTPGKYGIEAHYINSDGTTEYAGFIPNVTVEGVEPYMCEPHAIELDNGDILCHIRADKYGDKRVFSTFQSISEDKGKTWSEPRQLLDIEGGAPAHLLQLPCGDIISIYCDRRSPYTIKVMKSSDNGATWDTDNILYTNGVDDDIGYPATVQLRNGELFTVFYAHKDESSPAAIYGIKWMY